ncbi:MAG: Rnase Y domain-containing protein, partial [Desulfuromonadales bacterium]
MLSIPIVLLIAIICLVGGGLVGALMRRKSSESKLADAERDAARQLETARKEAETIRKEAEIQAKDAVFQAKAEWENEVRERRSELQGQEKRLVQKEENLDRKIEQVDVREQELQRRDQQLHERDRLLQERNTEIDRLVAAQRDKLEQIAGLTAEEAKQQLMAAMESEARHDAAKRIRQIEDEAKEVADKKAKNILSLAIQRYAGDYVAEKTVSAVPLPNDEMKGRIIGREGRNIRAIEAATGIDLIIDDTPEAVIISGFNPVRREVARLSLERLITDGRIHPSRIEEVVKKAELDVENTIREAGEQATFDVGVHGIHPEIV